MNGPHGADELVDAYGRKYLTVEERARFLAAVHVHRQPAVQTLACTLASPACRFPPSPRCSGTTTSPRP